MLSMNRVGLWVVAALALNVLGSVQAQDAPAAEKPQTCTPRFFDRPIDYWQRGIAYSEAKTADHGKESRGNEKSDPSSASSEWGQAIRLPDGTMAYQDLPKLLVRVLEEPTPDNIRAYFEWRMSRAQKILRAAELMKEYRSSSAPKLPTIAEEARSIPDLREPPEVIAPPEPRTAAAPPATPDAKRGFVVTYFHKQGCPHCDTQDRILAEWLKENPEGRLDAVEFGTRTELWKAYRVRGTPSLVVQDSQSKKAVFLEGLSRSDSLNAALRASRPAVNSQPTSEEK